MALVLTEAKKAANKLFKGGVGEALTVVGG